MAKKRKRKGVGLATLAVALAACGALAAGHWLTARKAAGNPLALSSRAVPSGARPNRQSEVPFELLHGHLFVRAALNGIRGVWLLDTGSNLTVMSPRIANLAHCVPVAAHAERDPYGISRYVRVDHLAIGQSEGSLPVAGVMLKLEDQVLSDDGVFVDGILGYDWLSHFVVQLDFPSRRLKLAQLDSAAVPAAGREVMALERVQGVPLVPVRIGAGPTRDLLLDTGANIVNLPWSFLRASGVALTRINRGPRIAGLAGRTNAGSLTIAKLYLGSTLFRHVQVTVTGTGASFGGRCGNIGT
ncbi:MAG: aspartyl protease family protein, partial [Cyanobacteria bacterium REEB65]|nr:aspartyl protease family protein [Cyanobacteria bacterium REEB65]